MAQRGALPMSLPVVQFRAPLAAGFPEKYHASPLPILGRCFDVVSLGKVHHLPMLHLTQVKMCRTEMAMCMCSMRRNGYRTVCSPSADLLSDFTFYPPGHWTCSFVCHFSSTESIVPDTLISPQPLTYQVTQTVLILPLLFICDIAYESRGKGAGL